MKADALPDTGPWRLVLLLRAWADTTPWCDWLELAGSLGRGAGDQWSDIDAGVGVTAVGVTAVGVMAAGVTAAGISDADLAERVAETVAAVTAFAPSADVIVESGGGRRHIQVQYLDGR